MSTAIARKIAADMRAASFIREMFEVGRKLKAQHGAENVFDFSLGNPNATPPAAFFDAVRAVAAEYEPARHRYMPNAGFDEARAAVAGYVRSEYDLPMEPEAVVLTSGAAGGLNVFLHAICDPGDEVIVLAPYFPEYRFYIEHAHATVVPVQTDAEFQPDLAALRAAVTPRTRAVLVNSPNNPTGAVYTQPACDALADWLRGIDSPARPIYLLLDEPYRRIVFDEERCPSPVGRYHRTILISSYSKDLSIAGERAGYIALPAEVPDRGLLLGACTTLNRTLGFVNCPAFMQRVIARCAGARCDVAFYRTNRDLLCDGLRAIGYELVQPRGALYAFPRTPLSDDRAFIDLLLRHKVLATPGSGFGRPGHMRLSFCVDRATIERGIAPLRAAFEEACGR